MMKVKFFSRWKEKEPWDRHWVIHDVEQVPAVGDYFNPGDKWATEKGFISCVELVIFAPFDDATYDVEVYGYRVKEIDVLTNIGKNDGE